MRTYFRRLQNHPGVPIATMFSLFGVVAALIQGMDWYMGLPMSIFWIPVLLTARTQPLPGEISNRGG
jgi:hypothetical protein